MSWGTWHSWRLCWHLHGPRWWQVAGCLSAGWRICRRRTTRCSEAKRYSQADIVIRHLHLVLEAVWLQTVNKQVTLEVENFPCLLSFPLSDTRHLSNNTSAVVLVRALCHNCTITISFNFTYLLETICFTAAGKIRKMFFPNAFTSSKEELT